MTHEVTGLKFTRHASSFSCIFEVVDIKASYPAPVGVLSEKTCSEGENGTATTESYAKKHELDHLQETRLGNCLRSFKTSVILQERESE